MIFHYITGIDGNSLDAKPEKGILDADSDEDEDEDEETRLLRRMEESVSELPTHSTTNMQVTFILFAFVSRNCVCF